MRKVIHLNSCNDLDDCKSLFGDYGFVPSGSNLLPDPVLTQICDTIQTLLASVICLKWQKLCCLYIILNKGNFFMLTKCNQFWCPDVLSVWFTLQFVAIWLLCCGYSGGRFTYDFFFSVIHINKIHFVVIPFLAIRFLQNFAHATMVG